MRRPGAARPALRPGPDAGPSASWPATIDPRLGLPPLTGFENHGGRTHLGPERLAAGPGHRRDRQRRHQRGRLARQAARHVLARAGAGPQPGPGRPAAALGDRRQRAAAAGRHLVRPAAAERGRGGRRRPAVIGAVRRVLGPRLPGRLVGLLGQPSARRFAPLLAAARRFGAGPAAGAPPGPARAAAAGRPARAGSPRSPPSWVGALLLVALVPRTFITLACGAIFGPVEGAGTPWAPRCWPRRSASRSVAAARPGVRRRAGPRPTGPAGRLVRPAERARRDHRPAAADRRLRAGQLRLRHHRRAAAAVPGRQRARRRAVRRSATRRSAPPSASPGQINWFAAAPAGLGLIASVRDRHPLVARRTPAPRRPPGRGRPAGLTRQSGACRRKTVPNELWIAVADSTTAR